MKIHEISIYDIKEYKNNPRKIPERAIDAVAASIKNFGFINPVVLDKDNVIVCGHTRLQAAKKIGFQEVPCVIADDLTPEQIKAFRLVDNKTGELSGWDFEKLDVELDGIDFDMSMFGFEVDVSDLDMSSLFEKVESRSQDKDEKYVTCPECGAKIKL